MTHTDRQAEAVRLALSGKSAAEVGRALGISRQAAQALLKRAGLRLVWARKENQL